MYNLVMDKRLMLSKEWWLGTLDELFNERISYPDVSWGYHFSLSDIGGFLWYKHQDMVLGYRYILGSRPEFIYLFIPSRVMIRRFLCLEELEEDLLVIRSMSDFSYIPLCLGVSWYSSILDNFLKVNNLTSD